MSNTPHNPEMARAIRNLIGERLAAQEERVFFLDHAGTVLSELRMYRTPAFQARQERTRRITSGELGAVVSTGFPLNGGPARISMVEIIGEVGDDPTETNVHALVSWFDGDKYTHRWLSVPEGAADWWINTWNEGGATGET